MKIIFFLTRCSVLFAGIGSTTHTPDFKAGTRRISGVRGYRAGLERLDKLSNQFWNVLFGSPVFQQLQAVTLLSKPTKHAFILPSIHSFKHFPPKWRQTFIFSQITRFVFRHLWWSTITMIIIMPYCAILPTFYQWFVYKLERDCSIYFL